MKLFKLKNGDVVYFRLGGFTVYKNDGSKELWNLGGLSYLTLIIIITLLIVLFNEPCPSIP